MKNLVIKSVSSVLLASAFGFAARADTLINNFTTPFNYVANGIVGDTNWDGVYLQFGDIAGGNPGGSGNGNTTIANTTTFAGYLGIQSIGTDWAGAGDDGFYIWKLVTGDFDVSVQSTPATLAGGTSFDNGGFNFAGLLVRAWNTNNSGAPVSFTSTNASENFLLNWRFQEFGLNQVRQATNGADLQNYNYPDGASAGDLASTRYFRITRTGNTFTFYTKTNLGDSWYLITNNALYPSGSLTRSDWSGQPVQVGLAQADFNTVTHDAIFTDFELSGPNVTFPTMPAAPSALITTATNIGGSLTLSWTLGNPGDGSLVMMRVNSPRIVASPVNGFTYAANSTYGDANTQLGAAGQYVVFSGTGNSVTVTNLAGNNLVYSVAVYEYTGSGASTVYNTASPVTNAFSGPGIITGVSTAIFPTNIPVGGASLGQLFATFSSGTGTVDESASSTWTSSDPTIAAFTGSVLTGLLPGSVTVTGSFGGFTATAAITVHAPVFTDNFGAYQDYTTNGIQTSTWDGLFLNYGDVPLTTTVDNRKGNDNAAGLTSVFLANTNVLFAEAAGSTWAVAGNDGPFLYKIITGDFQASVHVGPMSTINNCDAGLMARLYNNTGGASQGGGGGTAGTETHINWVKVQNGTPAVRRTIDSGGTTVVNGLNPTDRWLLMQRVNSTNFYFYESANPTGGSGWSFVTSLVVAEAAGDAPMEVGILQEMRTASDGFAPLDTLMIDGPGITPPATPPPAASDLAGVLNPDLSMTFNWVASDGANNPVRSALIMRANGPITAFPTLSQAGSIGGTGTPVNFGSGLNLGGGNWLVFATGNPAASTNVSCTVKNLSPGVSYSAAVVTFIGAGATKSFNNVLPASGATVTIVDGQLLSISVPTPPSIPAGGIGKPQVQGLFQGGAVVDISPFVTFIPANTNIIVTASGVLTGVTNGSTSVTANYKTFSVVFNVTVRSPLFVDNFNVNQDYLNTGVAGSAWDGVYNPNTIGPNPGVQIPESAYVPLDGSGATVADANITTNDQLTITTSGDGWENGASGGFFLFKYVSGDFQTAVHIKAMDILNYNMPGLLARAYSTGTNGTELGSPFVLSDFGESFVSICRFEEFGIGSYARLNLDSAVLQSTQPDQADGKTWLLIYRSNGTNFSFYKRATTSAPWENVPLLTSYQVAEFADQPMQVGIMAGPWFGGGPLRTAALENYLLDWTSVPPLSISQSAGNVTLSWAASPHLVLQSTPSLNPPVVWTDEPGTPTLGLNGYSVTMQHSGSSKFFRLRQ